MTHGGKRKNAGRPRVNISVSRVLKLQKTINTKNELVDIATDGRHDPCLCLRIVPVAEAMVALALCDAWYAQEALQETVPK